MKLWIRVDAALPRDPEVAELAACIGVKKTEAIGLLTCVWSAIAEHRPSGDVSGISPATLEDWALFEPRGKVKRGTFAAQFTRLFTRDGFVRGWTDRQGKLIERMEKDRKRKQQSAEPSTEIPQSFHGNSAPTERNGTEQDEEATTYNNDKSALLAKLPANYRPDVEALLRSLGSITAQYSWVRSLEAKLDGMHPPKVSPELLGRAIRQLNGNNEKPNWKRFEGYLRETPPVLAIPRSAPTDAKAEGLLIVGELRSKRVHHRAPESGAAGVYVIARSEIEGKPEPVRRAVDAIGGLGKIANISDDKFSILAAQFAAMYVAAINKSTEAQVA